jgi:hypothetical protein
MNIALYRQIFRKILKRFIKIRSMEAELFHADGQTDMTKLTKSLLNFVNAPKNVHFAHAVFMRFVFISEGTATSAIYRRIGFTPEIKSVFRAVRTGYLTRTVYHSFLNGSIIIFNYMILRSRRKCSLGLEFS